MNQAQTEEKTLYILGQSLNEILMPVSRQNAVKIISEISLELFSWCNTRIEWLNRKPISQIWKSKRLLFLRVIFIQLISINPKYDERNRIKEVLLLIAMVSFKVVDQCRVTQYFENYSSLLSSSFHFKTFSEEQNF